MSETCPMCAETIRHTDEVCPYCGEELYDDGDGHDPGGVYRDGQYLVMHQNAELPNRCIKSNGPADHELKRPMTWHHPGLNFLILAGILPYAVVVGLSRKRATVFIGLSEAWMARRRRAIIIGWMIVLLGVAVFIGAMATSDQVRGNNAQNLVALVILAAILLAIGGIIYGVMASRMVAPKRITDTHVWLKGVSPEYLAALPAWYND